MIQGRWKRDADPSPVWEREFRRVSRAFWMILRDAADAAPQNEGEEARSQPLRMRL
jgi:hypothetical protein